MKSLRLLLLFCTLTLSDAAAGFWGRGGARVTAAKRARGGSAESSADYAAVATLVWGSSPVIGQSIAAGCQLLGKDYSQWQGTALWQNTPALWKSMAFLSDVVVLVLDSRRPIDEELVGALEAGFHARLQDLPRSRLLIVLNEGELTKQELHEWKQKLQASLAGAVPPLLEELQIVESAYYDRVLSAMRQRSSSGVSQLADMATFPKLLRQVHKAFGGANVDLVRDVSPATSETAPSSPKTPTPSPKVAVAAPAAADKQEQERKILSGVAERLEDLQVAQEESWLDSGSMPVSFCAVANPILYKIERDLRPLDESVRAAVATTVKSRVRELYKAQLETLRDYYGRLYETTLDKQADRPESWKDVAKKVTDGFRRAAEQAVPALSREDRIFGDDDLHYHRTLVESGLISDMMEATDLRQDLVVEEDQFVEQTGQRRRLAKWYEKLAAKGLVIAVNYLQGWLAWQGIRRAAAIREQQMPKFPLF